MHYDRLNRKSAFNLKKDYTGKQSAHNLDAYAKTISSYVENIPAVSNECNELTK